MENSCPLNNKPIQPLVSHTATSSDVHRLKQRIRFDAQTAIRVRRSASRRRIDVGDIRGFASIQCGRHVVLTRRLVDAAVMIAFISFPVRWFLEDRRNPSLKTSPACSGGGRQTGVCRFLRANTDAAKASGPYRHWRPSNVKPWPQSIYFWKSFLYA
jgi:hypothetical protein